MAATVPVNISGLALLQSRMVAGIAHLRGYDLDDPRVRNAVLLTMLGPDAVKQLVKKKVVPGPPMVLATAPAYDETLDSVIAGEVTSSLMTRVVGKRAAKTVVRRIPVAGGFYGAGFVAVLAYAAPRLGISVALTAAIASQLVAALVVDHFGLFGVRVEPVTVGKVVGVALVIAGAVVVRRG